MTHKVGKTDNWRQQNQPLTTKGKASLGEYTKSGYKKYVEYIQEMAGEIGRQVAIPELNGGIVHTVASSNDSYKHIHVHIMQVFHSYNTSNRRNVGNGQTVESALRCNPLSIGALLQSLEAPNADTHTPFYYLSVSFILSQDNFTLTTKLEQQARSVPKCKSTRNFNCNQNFPQCQNSLQKKNTFHDKCQTNYICVCVCVFWSNVKPVCNSLE